MPEPLTFVFLIFAAALAGFVDAVVGGGGLIQLPALLLGLPMEVPVTTVLGTNKVVSFTGTSLAWGQFLRARVLGVREVVMPVLLAMAGAGGGVALAYVLEGRFEAWSRPVLLVLMVVMLVFTWFRPELGTLHAPRFGRSHQRGLAALLALALGFYDGFFGPGTGSLLIFLFVVVLGFDFLRASALAKAVNWASNLASLSLFVARGSWLPLVALGMALGNGLGGYWGARMALVKGNRWVRLLFMGVVSALVVRLGWQMWGQAVLGLARP